MGRTSRAHQEAGIRNRFLRGAVRLFLCCFKVRPSGLSSRRRFAEESSRRVLRIGTKSGGLPGGGKNSRFFGGKLAGEKFRRRDHPDE